MPKATLCWSSWLQFVPGEFPVLPTTSPDASSVRPPYHSIPAHAYKKHVGLPLKTREMMLCVCDPSTLS